MTTELNENQIIGLIHSYRSRMVANGQPVKVVFALVAMAGSGFPAGACMAWGCNRGYVEARQQQFDKPDKWEVIEIQPDQEIEA